MGVEPELALLSQAALARLTARTLEAALSIAGTDRGNVQLIDAKTGALTVVSQAGFDAEFLEYFAAVDDDNAACGRAARNHTQVVIPDVTRDPGFARHREIAAASGFRAVQSTPVIGRTGVTLGVVSTHFRRPHSPSAEQNRAMAFLGQLVGTAIEPHLERLDQLPAAGQAFADGTAVHLDAVDESAGLRSQAAQLQRALVSRVVIEQAKGFVAATNSIGIDDAFHLIRRYARNHNATIHAVAYAVVNRGLRL